MRAYEVVIERHIKPVLGKMKLDRLTPADVRTWPHKMSRTVNDRTGEVYSGETITNARRVLHAALQQAVKDGGLGLVRNPADASQGPRVEEKETPVFEPDEARRFAAAVARNRLEALYVVALGLGLRQGELFGLRWQDADLDGRVLHVRQQLQGRDGRLRLAPLKTLKSRRSLPMPGFVAEALTARRERQDAQGLVNVMGLRQRGWAAARLPKSAPKVQGAPATSWSGDQSFHALRHSTDVPLAPGRRHEGGAGDPRALEPGNDS